MKKKVIIGICVLLLLVLLIPIPNHLKDGGTVQYRALLYTAEKVHRLNPVDPKQLYQEGIILEIWGIKVLNTVK